MRWLSDFILLIPFAIPIYQWIANRSNCIWNIISPGDTFFFRRFEREVNLNNWIHSALIQNLVSNRMVSISIRNFCEEHWKSIFLSTSPRWHFYIDSFLKWHPFRWKLSSRISPDVFQVLKDKLSRGLAFFTYMWNCLKGFFWSQKNPIIEITSMKCIVADEFVFDSNQNMYVARFIVV